MNDVGIWGLQEQSYSEFGPSPAPHNVFFKKSGKDGKERQDRRDVVNDPLAHSNEVSHKVQPTRENSTYNTREYMARQKREKPDGMDMQILEMLAANPLESDNSLVSHCESKDRRLSDRTVEDRLSRLRELNLLTHRMRLVDLAATGHWFRYRVDIVINSSALRRRASKEPLNGIGQQHGCQNPQERLAYFIRDEVAKKSPDIIVEEVSVLMGTPADLSATVLVQNPRAIFDFVTAHLRSLQEIQSTSTSQISSRIFRDPVAGAHFKPSDIVLAHLKTRSRASK